MHGLEQLSCSNCWYNGLQQGSVGLSAGYCVEHQVVLRRADETTCARHLRKDLTLGSAQDQRPQHRRRYDRRDGVQLLTTAEPVENGVHLQADTSFLRRDPVGDAVADYGELRTKIESLATLRGLKTFRGDLALLSLGRSYTARCVERGGAWTSGLHLLMWARRRLEEEPEPQVKPEDLRYQTAVSLGRQVDLAAWGLVMLRLLFVSDIGCHAAAVSDPVGQLRDVAEEAAEGSGGLTLKRLSRWVRHKSLQQIDRALPWARYRELAAQLHEQREG